MMSDFEALGETLRLARESRGKTVADLSDEMGLPEPYLQALEKGDMASLPGLTYARIYFINYARTLGLDTEALMLQWPSQQESTPPVSASPPHLIKWRLPVAGLAAALVLIWLVAQLTGDSDHEGDDLDNSSGSADVPQLADSAQNSLPDSLVTATPGAIVVADPPAVEPEPSLCSLTVAATGESWVVVEADGDTVEARVMVKGQSITVEAWNEFALTAASPQNLVVQLNGSAVSLPKHSRRPLIRHRIATRGGAQ